MSLKMISFQLLRLASLLQLSGSDEKTRRGRVLTLVAQRALDHQDFTVAYNACAELMKTGYIPGWTICRYDPLTFIYQLRWSS
jgi:hypothetical protein